MEDLLGIAVRISITYVYVLSILRLTGKRTFDSLSPIDFAVGILVGDMFDDIFWAEIPLSQGLVGITTVLALHVLVAYFEHKSDWFQHLINSGKTQIIQAGQFIEEGLRKERFPKKEALADIRLLGEDRLDEIQEAYLEQSGKVSVIKKPEAEKAQKKDLPALQELFP